MGHLEGRLRKAEERAEQYTDTLTLPSGRVIQHGPLARWDCMQALLEGEDHWLLAEILAETNGEIPADPNSDDFVKILAALTSSSSRGGNEA